MWYNVVQSPKVCGQHQDILVFQLQNNNFPKVWTTPRQHQATLHSCPKVGATRYSGFSTQKKEKKRAILLLSTYPFNNSSKSLLKGPFIFCNPPLISSLPSSSSDLILSRSYSDSFNKSDDVVFYEEDKSIKKSYTIHWSFSVHLWYFVRSKDDEGGTIGGCKYAVFCVNCKVYFV